MLPRRPPRVRSKGILTPPLINVFFSSLSVHFQLTNSVYALKGWTHIDDHLYSALAKHSIATQMIQEAVDFYVELLGNQEHKPLERQQIYLRDFIMVMRQVLSV